MAFPYCALGSMVLLPVEVGFYLLRRFGDIARKVFVTTVTVSLILSGLLILSFGLTSLSSSSPSSFMT
jgi:hypothetical protein